MYRCLWKHDWPFTVHTGSASSNKFQCIKSTTYLNKIIFSFLAILSTIPYIKTSFSFYRLEITSHSLWLAFPSVLNHTNTSSLPRPHTYHIVDNGEIVKRNKALTFSASPLRNWLKTFLTYTSHSDQRRWRAVTGSCPSGQRSYIRFSTIKFPRLFPTSLVRFQSIRLLPSLGSIYLKHKHIVFTVQYHRRGVNQIVLRGREP